MYTKLPQQRIIDNIRKAITEAQQYHQSLPTDTAIPLLPDPDIVMDHLTFIVSNTFLGNDPDNLRQQTIGLPMGTNSAPEIANLCLYADESSFVDDLISRNDLQTARKYASTKRYIDDLLLWDLSPPPITTYGLEYSETTEPDGTVTFLGAQINLLSNGYISVSIYDKTASWNFPVIRYTHGHSNVPTHQATGIVFSQLTRYRLICNSITNFKKATTSLVKKLLERNHSPMVILRGWERYLIKYSMHDENDKNVALRIWFRKLMKWASYHIINPLHQRHPSSKQPSTQLQHPTSSPTADNKLPVVGENTLPVSQVRKSRNNLQHPTPIMSTSNTVKPPSTRISNTSKQPPSRTSSKSLIPSKPLISNNKPRKKSNTRPNPTSLSSTYTLHTNQIPTIRGYSKNSSVLLSIDSDATKDILFTNLQPVIQDLLKRQTERAQMLTSITTFITNIPDPVIGYSIVDQSSSYERRYNATNPNGACGYILSFQLYNSQHHSTVTPYIPTPLDLYNPNTRRDFLSFLQENKDRVKDKEYKYRISGAIDWVTNDFNTVAISSEEQPRLNYKFWMVDDMLLRFNLQTTFTYFINSNIENNYLKCMFSSSTTCKVHYTYADLLSIANTSNYIQYASDHFLFLENPISTTNITNINEAITALSDNILTYFLNHSASVNATIKYYVEPVLDLSNSPPSSPKHNFQQTSSADNMLPVEGESGNSHLFQPTKEVPMNTQAQVLLHNCRIIQPSSTTPEISLQPTNIVSTRTTSGAPAPLVDDVTSNTYLFRYVNDPIFTSIRPFFYRIVDNARKRESGFNTQPTQCTTCKQFFSKMSMHMNNVDSITGCYNVARLRMYICLRKNIPLPPSILPSGMAHPTIADLEKHLLKFN